MGTSSIERAMILETAVDRLSCLKGQMGAEFRAFDAVCHRFGYAAHPLPRPDKRLALSLLLAYPGRQRRRFAPATRLNAPSSASNYGF